LPHMDESSVAQFQDHIPFVQSLELNYFQKH